jgi:hypothetical protein
MNYKDWFLHQIELVNQINHLDPNQMFIGLQEPSGKITYSGGKSTLRSTLQKEFGQLDYLVPILVNRKYFDELPSLATVLKGSYPQYLVLHPNENEEEDIETIQELFDDLTSLIYGLCILDSKTTDMSHGIAFIAWTENDTNHFAFYDPLAYKRKRVRVDGSIYYMEYDYAKQVLEFIQEEVEFEIHDLSVYCIQRSTEEYDCPQYIMNAEYCFYNSLYFLYQWCDGGQPLTKKGFKEVVHKSYVIDPLLFTRSYTKEMLVYKTVLLSFILRTTIIYLQSILDTPFFNAKELLLNLLAIQLEMKDVYHISI